MAAKDVKFGADAREKMLRSVDTHGRRLASLLLEPQGPQCRANRKRDYYSTPPRTTGTGRPDRGRAKSNWPTDLENMGAQMVREVASKTNDAWPVTATTTATVLARAIVREGAKSVAAGMNPMDLKLRGIEHAVEAVVADLKKRSKKLSSPTRRSARSAPISANGDKEVGRHDCPGHGQGWQ